MSAPIKTLIWLALIHSATRLEAQGCHSALSPDSAETLAERYAPILQFAPGEQYFPTIPFFHAFDRVGVPAGSPNPFLDPARLAVLTTGRRMSWERLVSDYELRRAVLDTAPDRLRVYAPTHSAVFFRVRCLDSHSLNSVWTFLRNDPQAWARSDLERLHDHGLQAAEFVSIEYYMYYVNDRGLQGHPHDIEKVFILTPINSPREDVRAAEVSYLSDTLVTQLKIIVGAGHSPTTPNNVLVLTHGTARSDSELL